MTAESSETTRSGTCSCRRIVVVVGAALAAAALYLAAIRQQSMFTLRGPLHVDNDRLAPSSVELFPPERPLRSCPNYFVVASDLGGIGHRFSAIVTAIGFAVDAQAAVILDDDMVNGQRPHGDFAYYPWLRRLFNLYSFATSKEMGLELRNDGTILGVRGFPLAEAKVHPIPNHPKSLVGTAWEAIAIAKTSCNNIMELRTGRDWSCWDPLRNRSYYCITTTPGSYQRSRSYLQRQFELGEYAQLPLYQFMPSILAPQPTIVVAWHVRNDDAKIHASDHTYWLNLISNVVDMLNGIPAVHYFVCQNPIARNDTSFGFLYNVSGFTWTELAGLPIATAIYHLAGADVLVHSGSSFSYASGLIAPSSQVAVYASPKESGLIGDRPYRSYWYDGVVPLQRNGTILAHDRVAGTAKVLQRLSNRPAQWYLRPLNASFVPGVE